VPERVSAILVVEPAGGGGSDMVGLLGGTGHRVIHAASFGKARSLLRANPPDLLITELRLGAFNGLHLVLCARNGRPIPAIVVAPVHDAILEAEATRQERVAYFVRPLNPEQFLETVSRLLAEGTGEEGTLHRSGNMPASLNRR
jgi:DNA-binding NtrC family response regulator